MLVLETVQEPSNENCVFSNVPKEIFLNRVGMYFLLVDYASLSRRASSGFRPVGFRGISPLNWPG